MIWGMAANSINVTGAGYLWCICVSLWVIFGSFVGPWWISKMFVRGASGVADLIFGAGSTGVRAAQFGGRAAGAAATGGGSVVAGAAGGGGNSSGGSRRFP